MPPGNEKLNSFKETLERIEVPPHPLVEALEFMRGFVPNATNIGESGDRNDLYFLIDTMNEAIKEAVPGSVCAAGCSRCCHFPIALFNISPLEWRTIEVFLDGMEEEGRERILGNFRRDFKKKTKQLSLIQWIVDRPISFVPKLGGLPCPFLEKGNCAIYPARPLYCRTFGYYTVVSGMIGNPRFYSCGVQGNALEAQLRKAGPQVGLPSANPLIYQLDLLNRLDFPKWTGWRLLLNLFGFYPDYPVILKERWLQKYEIGRR